MGAPEDEEVMPAEVMGLAEAIMLSVVIGLAFVAIGVAVPIIGDEGCIIGLDDEDAGEAPFDPQPASARVRTPPARASAGTDSGRRMKARRPSDRADRRWDMRRPLC
jgi:hypothetical protein